MQFIRRISLLMVFMLFAMPYSATAEWSMDSSVNTPVVAASDSQSAHRIIHDGKKGYFVVWHDFRNNTNTGGDIYAQYFNAEGNPQWGTNGTLVCNASGHQVAPKVTLDGSGGIIVSWEDYRNDYANSAIYAQKLNSNGVPQWTTNGVAVHNTPGSDNECGWIVPDGSGGAIIASDNNDNGVVNRINASGTLPWGSAVNFNPGNVVEQIKIMADGSGGVICVWSDDDSDYIAAQRVDSNGNLLWNRGSEVVLSPPPGAQCPRIVTDRSSGAIIIWQKEIGDTELYHIYAQKVDSTGATQWISGGVQITSANTTEHSHGLASDEAGGAFITWINDDNGNVYTRKITSNQNLGGTIQLSTAGGCSVSDSPRKTVEDGKGGCITIWKDNNGNVRSQRVDSSGNTVWSSGGVILSNASGSKGCPRIEGTSKGGAVGVWSLRSGETSSYADYFTFLDSSWWEVTGDDTWIEYTIPAGDFYLGYIESGETTLVTAALGGRDISNYKINLHSVFGFNTADDTHSRCTGIFFGGDEPEDEFERFAAQICYENDSGEGQYWFRFNRKEYDAESGTTNVTTYSNQMLSGYTPGESYRFSLFVEHMGPGYSSVPCTGDNCFKAYVYDYFNPSSLFIYTFFEVDHEDLYGSGSVGLETESPGAYTEFRIFDYYIKNIYMQSIKPNGKLGSPWFSTLAPIMLQLLGN